MVKLGVNIDYFAVLRQTRQIPVPDLIEIVKILGAGGAGAIAVHMRQDRRFIQDDDLTDLKRHIKSPLHVYVSGSWPQGVAAVSKAAPHSACLISENARDCGRRFSLDMQSPAVQKEAGKAIAFMKKRGVKTFVFLGPQAPAIRLAKKLGADGIELNAWDWSQSPGRSRRQSLLEDLHIAGRLVHELGLELNISHGIEYDNIADMAGMTELSFIYVGFPVAVRSVFTGLPTALAEIFEAIGPGAEMTINE
ncbi:MAG: pyridoxine 5'-phosphate synthase [Elusimicrobia bacterium]|nr:pyridoxine 5'-phosphate synthase [Elusimicrobiota bacterium]